jgi:alpha-mannosidase
MNASILLRGFSVVALLVAFGSFADAAPLQPLWQIGKFDDGNHELALAPNRYSKFSGDGFFVVGESDAKRDWPYVHPGPSDGWAGARPHTFTILFALKTLPAAGDGQLEIDLLDTHSQGPPKLRVEINGLASDHTLPRGLGDDTVNGRVAKGREHKIAIKFPVSQLKRGDNEVRIWTGGGSWVLYDALWMTAPAGAELARVESRTVLDEVKAVRALQQTGNGFLQPVQITLRHFGENAAGTVKLEGGPMVSLNLTSGMHSAELLVPAVESNVKRRVWVESQGKVLATREITLKPVKKLTVYVLPHSHTDIGYTEIQTAIEKKQVQNLIDGMAAAKRTASYPPGSRFIWNVEVLWAADLYLQRLGDQQRADFLAAVKNGQVELNGMYLNELTALCRPEELVRLFEDAPKLAKLTGVPIESVMISDVPGYTWATVTAMAQAGLKYFSTAPNYFDRIGTILREWENKPFYWQGPDGKSKVLVWIPFWGYAMSHRYGKLSPQLVDDFYEGLEKRDYPFDIAHVRWSGHGDNAIPDPAICEFIRDWNAKYAYPKFVISGTTAAFRAFEKRYGDKLPVVRGDWTPYWEDGAGSSALETAMNRESSDRLAQAETLFAMFNPAGYPARRFEAAWKNVLLYSEHTWGADVSISQPESQKTREQWEIKKSYAEAADKQSRALLTEALALGGAPGTSPAIEVINSLSWPRTELVTLSKEQSAAGDRVIDDTGKPVPSQRLSTGELVFLASGVPAFASKRFTVTEGAAHSVTRASANGHVLENGIVRVRIDENTGGIVELTADGKNFANTSQGQALNEYLYLPGDDLKGVKKNGPVQVRVGERGPLLASLIVESSAPGCKKLTREIRMVAGMDHVEVINIVDKERLAAKSYHAKEGKESVNFGFPFAVPDGALLLDLPLGMMAPNADQMPSACKNWYTVGRWVDVSNRERGITWVTLDAPLLQVGGLTATLLNSQTNPDTWLKDVPPTQRIYSWAMNNHWGTNYRAYQDGRTVFRFILRPHKQRDPAEATRFATGFSQPLLARRASAQSTAAPLLSITGRDVIATAVKPSTDGRALIVRLYGAGVKESEATLTWLRRPTVVSFSDTSERAGAPAGDTVRVPAQGLVTLRADLTVTASK